MRKRITCITIFDKESLNRINKVLLKLDKYHLCKVPYLIEPYTVKDRETADTLPYHFTLSYWDETKRDSAVEIFCTIHIPKIELLIEDVVIKEGNNGSYNMYFSFKINDQLKEIQNDIYRKTKNEKFNPDTYIPHISIHSDKDYNKLVKMRNILIRNFEKFIVSFDTLGLFEIYPAVKIL